jgi:cell division initiation protein
MAEEPAVTPPLTPGDVRSPNLTRSFRGYDTAAVDRLLGRVAESMEVLAAERDDLRARVAKLDTSARETDESQRLLGDALVSAQQAGEEMKQRAQRESEQLLARAKAEAGEIAERSRIEREHAEAELERLRTQERELRASYRVLLAAALERLEERAEDVGAPKPSLLDALAPRRLTVPADEPAER